MPQGRTEKHKENSEVMVALPCHQRGGWQGRNSRENGDCPKGLPSVSRGAMEGAEHWQHRSDAVTKD